MMQSLRTQSFNTVDQNFLILISIDETYQIVCNNQANFGCYLTFEFTF